MRLPKFSYCRPRRLEEAVQLLTEHPGARPLAGGTDLLVNAIADAIGVSFERLPVTPLAVLAALKKRGGRES